MALNFSISYPVSSGSSGPRPLLHLKAEQQYFEISYSGALATDKIYVEEKQDGTNWTTLADITIGSSGAGKLKDIVGDFKLNGSHVRVVGKNASGNTTYATYSFATLEQKDSVKKDFGEQMNDLFLHGEKSQVKDKPGLIYKPALADTVALIDAEDNTVITESNFTSTTTMTGTNLEFLPDNIKMSLRRHPSSSFINGINLKSFPQATNSDFSGAGGEVTATNKPVFVGNGKYYTFAETSNDGGLNNGEKFLKVLKANIGKYTYDAEAKAVGSQGGMYSTYNSFKNTYNSIATAKTTELF